MIHIYREIQGNLYTFFFFFFFNMTNAVFALKNGPAPFVNRKKMALLPFILFLRPPKLNFRSRTFRIWWIRWHLNHTPRVTALQTHHVSAKSLGKTKKYHLQTQTKPSIRQKPTPPTPQMSSKHTIESIWTPHTNSFITQQTGNWRRHLKYFDDEKMSKNYTSKNDHPNQSFPHQP